jgi:hypothetical protein
MLKLGTSLFYDKTQAQRPFAADVALAHAAKACKLARFRRNRIRSISSGALCQDIHTILIPVRPT